MKNKKNLIFIIIVVIVLIVLAMISKRKFDVNQKIATYDLKNEKDYYLNYLRQYIYPIKLRDFIYNEAIAFSIYNDNATGKSVISQMEFDGYECLFKSMFDKTRTNFDDCPVTENFKNKFNTNLMQYFNLIESEDCESNCLLNREDENITIEVFGNFKNTEPTYWTTHHFKYTLDDEGNVDDIIFEYTEQ